MPKQSQTSSLILSPIDGTPIFFRKNSFLILSFLVLSHIHIYILISATSILFYILISAPFCVYVTSWLANILLYRS